MSHEAAVSLRSQVREAIEAAWEVARADPGAGFSRRGARRPARRSDGARDDRAGPADPSFGDFASNIALKLAKPYRRPPMEIARAIAAHVVTTATDPDSPIATVEVAPPGSSTSASRTAGWPPPRRGS